MKAKVNGIEVNYEIHGKEGAPWLTFSHSLACSLRMWDPQLAAFKDRFASCSTTRAATAARRRRAPTRSTCWRRTCASCSPS